MTRRLITLLFLGASFALPSFAYSQEVTDDAPGARVRTDRQAWESIGAMDLEQLEQKLEEGWRRIADLAEDPGNPLAGLPDNDPRLRILWDQLYYRLSAVAGGAYAVRLRYAERVVYPDVAIEQLEALKLSLGRLDRLVRLVGRAQGSSAFRSVDPLAAAIVPDYQMLIPALHHQLREREKLVLTRLEAGPRHSIVDVASLSRDPIFGRELAQHRQKLDNPVAMPAEACRRLADFDPDNVGRLVACADTVGDRASATFLLDAAKFRLATMETSLDRARRTVRRVLADPYPSGDLDYLQMMESLAGLVVRFHDPRKLEQIYGVGERIAAVEENVARRPYVPPAPVRPGEADVRLGIAR